MKNKNGRLVLVRKKFESITLFDKNNRAFMPIVVEVASINGNRVSIAIVAEPHIGIVRSELFERKQDVSQTVVSANSETEGV